jgi:FkbM family methyltransferase
MKKKTKTQTNLFDQLMSPLSRLNQNKKGSSKFEKMNRNSDLKDFAKMTKLYWHHKWSPLRKVTEKENMNYTRELHTLCENVINKYKELEIIENGEESKYKEYISTPSGLKLYVGKEIDSYEFVRNYYDVIYSDISAHIVDKKFRASCGYTMISFLENIDYDGGWNTSLSSPKQNDVVLDIGAGYGFFALLAIKILGASKVYVFEPNKIAREIIIKNRELNGITKEQMPIFNYAFGESSGMAFLYSQPTQPCSGTIEKISADEPSYKNQHYEPTEMITLDDFVHKLEGNARQKVKDDDTKYVPPKINFIKIHTNGDERRVLKGASYLLNFYEDLPDIVVNTSFSPYEYKLSRIILDEFTNKYDYLQRISKFHAAFRS